MTGKRLERLVDGRLQATDASAPILQSAQTCWSGFPLERSVSESGSAGSIVLPSTEIILVAAGSISVRYRDLCTTKSFVGGPGSITIWPSGHDLTLPTWTVPKTEASRTELLRVQLDGSSLEHLAPLESRILGDRLAQRSAIDDATLVSLMQLIEADVRTGCRSGKLYGESLSLALAVHVAKHYSTMEFAKLPHEGLSRPVLARVLDFIQTNLGRDLTISDLAGVANMSPHHFSLRFKCSVGVAPHQWVTRARVREAERLLAGRSLPISEVALSLGFASQSHFTTVFRRFTGTTPKQYQRMP